MAGLICDACQEVTVVLQTHEVIEDLDGRAALPRWRVCTNPSCELYLLRRDSYEALAPLTEHPVVLHPASSKLMRGKSLPTRASEFPIDPILNSAIGGLHESST